MKEVKGFILKYLNLLKELIIKNKNIIYMALPFIAMDVVTRVFGNSIGFYKVYRIFPNLFTLLYIYLFLGIVLNTNKKVGKISYLFFNILFVIMYLVNNVYYSMTSNYFSFNLLDSVSEGSPYFLSALKNCNIFVYIFLIIIIFLIILGYKSIDKVKKESKNNNDNKKLIKIFILFIIVHTILPFFLGFSNDDLVWNTWKNPRNIYELYNDNNKSLRLSGLYEYTFRNFYVTFIKREEKNDDDLKFLEDIYNKEVKSIKNSYTGKFKGKNVIFLQLEGMDNWLITKKDTPTLYNMINNSINFTNHYSFYTGGGSTFNSEFAVNTGFIVPYSYNKNAYSFNNNYFPYSLPNMFKSLDYSVNAFHMNKKEYYSRGINYKNWNYDNYYGLIDMYKYTNGENTLDRELILNEEYSNLMFNKEKLFVDYIITYSPHIPFDNTRGVCKILYEEDNKDLDVPFKQMSEEECARRQAKETDYFVSLLLDKLKANNLLDNTVLVVFSDHYLYTLEDQTILNKYKNTSNNLINKTPFFIYDNGNTKKTINKVTSQLNILPTVLNLFGIEYNPNYYLGQDALGKNYESIVVFSDYSWYDGNVYVEGGKITNKKYISKEELERKNILINEIAKKNDLTLKYNYFKKISE